jgi:hypothetical protein
MNYLFLFQDFFRFALATLRRMESPLEPWLGVALVVVFGLLFFLRIRFSNVSKGVETAALAAALVLLFLVGHVYLTPQKSTAGPAGQFTPGRAVR